MRWFFVLGLVVALAVHLALFISPQALRPADQAAPHALAVDLVARPAKAVDPGAPSDLARALSYAAPGIGAGSGTSERKADAQASDTDRHPALSTIRAGEKRLAGARPAVEVRGCDVEVQARLGLIDVIVPVALGESEPFVRVHDRDSGRLELCERRDLPSGFHLMVGVARSDPRSLRLVTGANERFRISEDARLLRYVSLLPDAAAIALDSQLVEAMQAHGIASAQDVERAIARTTLTTGVPTIALEGFILRSGERIDVGGGR